MIITASNVRSEWIKRFGVDRYEGAEYPKHIIILKQVIRYHKEFIHAQV